MATDSRALKIAENAYRQNFLTADKMFEADGRIIKQTTDYLDRVMQGVSRKPESAETAGAAVQSSVEKAIRSMVDMRRKVTEPLYSQIDKSGARVSYSNLANELKSIIDEYSGALDDVSQGIVSNAKRKLDEIASPVVDESGATQLKILDVPASAAAKTRSGFSAQTASGGLFKDIDKANNRRLAARLADATQRDLEQAESVAPILKEANALWRKHSARIKQAESTILGKVVGKQMANDIDDVVIGTVAPERVYDSIVKLKPSEAKFVRGFLDRHNPEVVQKVKRAMLQEAYDSMFKTPMSAGADGRPQLGKFVDFVNKNKSIGKWFSDDEMKSINDGVQIIKRVGDKFGYNNSFTAGQTFFNELLTSPLKGAHDVVVALGNVRAMDKAVRSGTHLKPASKVAPLLGAPVGQASAQSMQDERGQ
jgi:hypothetical protein